MKQRTQDLLFAACGIASVAVLLAGVGIGAAGGREFATTTSSTAQVTKALATPAGDAVWAGAYIELLSYGFFIAFAVWACAKLGGGILGSIGRATATAYTTLSVASLCLMGAIEYRAGHGIGLQLGRTLITLNEALFIGTWFLAVFFLLAVGPLALASGRRLLGWSAIAIGGNHARDHCDLVRQPRPDVEPAVARLDRRRQHRARPWRTAAPGCRHRRTAGLNETALPRRSQTGSSWSEPWRHLGRGAGFRPRFLPPRSEVVARSQARLIPRKRA